MPRVTNLKEEGITILRWRLLPKSHVFVDPQGRMVEDVPAFIAYSDQVRTLADQGVLRVEGYGGPRTAPTKAPPSSATVAPDRRDRKFRKQER